LLRAVPFGLVVLLLAIALNDSSMLSHMPSLCTGLQTMEAPRGRVACPWAAAGKVPVLSHLPWKSVRKNTKHSAGHLSGEFGLMT